MKGLQVLSVMSHFDPVFYLEMSPLLGRGSMTMAFTGKLVYTEREREALISMWIFKRY